MKRSNVPFVVMTALASVTVLLAVPASLRVTDQPTTAAPVSKTVTLTSPLAAGQRSDAREVCALTRPSWRPLCQRVWVRPAFSWTAHPGGNKLSDPAGPAEVIDALSNAAGDLTSRDFLTGLQGWDADWSDAHPATRH